MAGLVPAIHVFAGGEKDVDARHKAGHDEELGNPPRQSALSNIALW
jgi:hypothetical protein